MASVFAVASFAAMALPITIKRQQKLSQTNEAILLTPGFDAGAVGKLLQVKDKKTPVYFLDKDLKIPGTFDVQFISDAGSIAGDQKKLAALHVFGEGLEKEELESLQNLPLVFHEGNLPTGITAINWPRKLRTGGKLQVQGTFKNNTAAEARMILQGFDTNLDSLTLAPNSTQTFELSNIPKHTGQAVYSIIVVAGKDTIIKESIPVEVWPIAPLKVLLLAASPDFENKFLKNWLAENGNQVAMRTTISKNKYSKEFLNMPTFSIDRLNGEVLGKFDVVIADEPEYAALGKQEQGLLQYEVEQKGLGLIITTDSSLGRTAFYAPSFPLVKTNHQNEMTVKIRLSDTTFHLPDLTIEQPLFIRPQLGMQPLVMDQQANYFAGVAIAGTGKILVSTLTNTYQWVLMGNNDGYQQLWSTLLNKVTRQPSAKEVWNIKPSFPRINQAVQLQLETSGDGLPYGQVGENLVYLQQDNRLPYRWRGSYWPEKKGWQPLIQTDGSTYWWYAFEKKDYKSISAIEKAKLTQQYAQQHPWQPGKASNLSPGIEVEFPKVWFFIVMLVCCGFLWLEKKFLS